MSKILHFPTHKPEEDGCSVRRMLEDLLKLESEGKLKHFMGVIFYKDGKVATWRSTMTHGSAGYGVLCLQHRLMEEMTDCDLGPEDDSEPAA